MFVRRIDAMPNNRKKSIAIANGATSNALQKSVILQYQRVPPQSQQVQVFAD
jgi:hypothetical protein